MLPESLSRDELLASARMLQEAWECEVTLLLGAVITPRDASGGDLNHIGDVLEDAALGVERLEGIRLAMRETVEQLRIALGIADRR